MRKEKYILYAAYGSNLLLERFYSYIKGTEFLGIKYEGCDDKSDPEDYGSMMVPHRLYFAKRSKRWEGGGVAFLSIKEEKDPYYYSVIRLWKVTLSQFDDIQRQEGGWYNQILNLGKKNNMDIITFTGKAEFEKEKNKPCDSYLEIIKKGLIQTKGWNVGECEQYIKKFI